MSKCIGLILITVLAVTVNQAMAKTQFVKAPESAAFDDKAQGVLVIGEKQVIITFAAGAISSSFGKIRAHIYLANDTIDPFGRELQGQVERGERHYVEITIDENGSVIGFNICTNIIHDGKLMGLNAAPVQFNAKKIGGDRVTGEVINKQPVISSFNNKLHRIKVDANFSAALLQTGAIRSGKEEEKSLKPDAVKSGKDDKKLTSLVAVEAKVELNPVWKNAKTVMEEILQVTGTDVQPVYLFFNDAGDKSLHFHYQTATKDEGIKTIEWSGGKLRGPSESGLARPCPPIPLEDIDLDLVQKIYRDVSRKTARGYRISVTLGRRFADGCNEPEWQGIGQYMSKLIIISYSIDGKQTDIKENSF